MRLKSCSVLRRCCSRTDDKELLFRDGEVLLDDQGLRLLPHVDKGWHHVLSSARRASSRAPMQVCSRTYTAGSTLLPAGPVAMPCRMGRIFQGALI